MKSFFSQYEQQNVYRLCDLKQSCGQVADDEGGRHGSMGSLQEVDGVQEEEVTRDYKKDQDSGWFRVNI